MHNRHVMISGERIKAARDRVAENQTKFAQRFGVNQGTLCRWERRGAPRMGTAARLIELELAAIEGLPPEKEQD